VRTGVFFQAGDDVFVNQILDALRKCSLAGSGYRLGPGWETLDGEELAFNFAGISHFILIPNEVSFRSRWLSFLAGFGMGGGKVVCMVLRPGLEPVPSYLRAVHQFSDAESLCEYLREETDIWDKTYRIEKARESLIALGIGINEANLAQRVAAGDDDAVLNFLHIGYSADTQDQGVPVLITATRNGHRKIVDILLEHGADVNVIAQDRGNTALMEAAVRGDELSVRRFLESGADPDLQSKSGQTALMLAVGEGHKNVVKAILAYRPNIEMCDQLGMTATKYASLFRHEEILSMIEKHQSALV